MSVGDDYGWEAAEILAGVLRKVAPELNEDFRQQVEGLLEEYRDALKRCADGPTLCGTLPPKDYLVALVTAGLHGSGNGMGAMRRYLVGEGLDPTDVAPRMLMIGAELVVAVLSAWSQEVERPRVGIWQGLMARRAAYRLGKRT